MRERRENLLLGAGACICLGLIVAPLVIQPQFFDGETLREETISRILEDVSEVGVVGLICLVLSLVNRSEVPAGAGPRWITILFMPMALIAMFLFMSVPDFVALGFGVPHDDALPRLTSSVRSGVLSSLLYAGMWSVAWAVGESLRRKPWEEFVAEDPSPRLGFCLWLLLGLPWFALLRTPIAPGAEPMFVISGVLYVGGLIHWTVVSVRIWRSPEWREAVREKRRVRLRTQRIRARRIWGRG